MQLLRELAPQVLAIVLRKHGDFAACEDAVQEALLAASQQWAEQGVPDHPRAWLVRVASRRRIDAARADAARKRREDALELSETAEPSRDDSLEVLVTCCHPALTSASAIALTLRAVGGLTTAEIAAAFLVPETTMAQRISRAKATIKSSGVGFESPTEHDLFARLPAVLHTIYLVFNEGYTELSRTDLAAEAIRLARLLLRLVPDHVEARGLLALMLLTDARRAARTGSRGELIPLDEQDRSTWNSSQIAEGLALVHVDRDSGLYQLQAAIAACHDTATSTDDTDWASVAALYAQMLVLQDNPMTALSHAIAVAMVQGPTAGLALVDALAPRLPGHYRIDAVRAHLFERSGDRTAAAAHYRAAADKTASAAERDYLLAKAAIVSP